MKNIVWLVSYPKSGNTWFRLFLSNYCKGSASPLPPDHLASAPIASGAGSFEEHTGLNPFELTPDEVDLYRADLYRVLSEESAETGSPLYKKSHDAYTLNSLGEPLFPEDVSKCALYIVRNPLDVCVSYANHNGSQIDGYARQINNEEIAIAGYRSGQLRQKLLSWKSHVKSWQEQTRIPLFTIRYEDMLLRGMETFSAAL
ncbi:MAG: sulfotransferase domain-containing protein, partial [Bacteroidales bacterium]